MSARILVVDDVDANVALLRARLEAEYFEVLCASSGPEALNILQNEAVDLVLLDVMMPGMDGFTVCKTMKADPAISHIPVVMITALDKPTDRNHGLACGADDFLTKPVNEIQLFARVKSLVRLKLLTDELRLRAVTTQDVAIRALLNPKLSDDKKYAKVLLVDERRSVFESVRKYLLGIATVDHEVDPAKGVLRASGNDYDCFIASSEFADYDPLKMCAKLRSAKTTRFLPIIMMCENSNDTFLSRALDIGVNDYLHRPIDGTELVARVNTQVRRKRYHDGLRTNVAESVELSVLDGLTGLNNRRYFDHHFATLVERSKNRGRQLSLLIADIDNFKSVNDRHGHDAGDEVLREFARRLRLNIRGIDLACRYGGEEFVVLMPDTNAGEAEEVAERLRFSVAGSSFDIPGADKKLQITASIGIGILHKAKTDTVEALLKRADNSLYAAKQNGRNQVVSLAA